MSIRPGYSSIPEDIAKFFVPIVRLSILFTLIESSLQRSPQYNGQLIPPQDGHCREVRLYLFSCFYFIAIFAKLFCKNKV